MIIVFIILIMILISSCKPKIEPINDLEYYCDLWNRKKPKNYTYSINYVSHSLFSGLWTYVIEQDKLVKTLWDGEETNKEVYISMDYLFDEVSKSINNTSCYEYNVIYNQDYGYVEFFNKVLGEGCNLPSDYQFAYKITSFEAN